MPATLSSRWKAKKVPFVSLLPKPSAHRHYENLVWLDLSDSKLMELPDSVTNLIHLITLVLCRNNFERLPATMDQLRRLKIFNLEACRRLISIPQLSSNITKIDAHDCTALETVSTPKPHYMNLYFIFSNCLRLVQKNPFRDIVEAHCHDQGNHLRHLSFNMSLPGSDIPDWFSQQCTGSSVTAQLQLNLFHNKLLGFAKCAVSNFKSAHYCASNLSVQCFCTFKGNHHEYSSNIYMLDWDFKTDRFLESDHMFLGYVPWSKYGLIETGKQANERCYTEATFKFDVKDGGYVRDFRAAVRYPSIRRNGGDATLQIGYLFSFTLTMSRKKVVSSKSLLLQLMVVSSSLGEAVTQCGFILCAGCNIYSSLLYPHISFKEM
ncbi:hypothetical protein EV1_001774 [Malus domestica]